VRVIKIFVLAFILLGCSEYEFGVNLQHTDIAEIKANPNGFYDKDILIKGIVIDATKIFNFKLFKIQDKSDYIWVVTEKNIPKEGQYIEMIVTLNVVASFKDDSIGIHVIEKKRI